MASSAKAIVIAIVIVASSANTCAAHDELFCILARVEQILSARHPDIPRLSMMQRIVAKYNNQASQRKLFPPSRNKLQLIKSINLSISRYLEVKKGESSLTLAEPIFPPPIQSSHFLPICLSCTDQEDETNILFDNGAGSILQSINQIQESVSTDKVGKQLLKQHVSIDTLIAKYQYRTTQLHIECQKQLLEELSKDIFAIEKQIHDVALRFEYQQRELRNIEYQESLYKLKQRIFSNMENLKAAYRRKYRKFLKNS